MEDGKFVVVYARVSTESQDCEMQIEALEKKLDEETLEVKVLKDNHSGRKMDAPNLIKLSNWVETGKVARIYVYSWDRLGRNMLLGCEFIKMCLENGTNVISLLENSDLRTNE